ncbi:ATP-dependent 6-phosphofructokinase 6 [Carex littledalei]|uniref:ATP-dependent 6-phosphofructokinase 6 n=1 Tax=Carex littledalei TaxID=544730 RepID=A0A833QS55_9POAL|nr:ATP-dependent 6-phosphofructokinase 6 [Carex littledalei]
MPSHSLSPTQPPDGEAEFQQPPSPDSATCAFLSAPGSGAVRPRLNGHMVIVAAEGAGQDLIADSLRNTDHDASGNLQKKHIMLLLLGHVLDLHYTIIVVFGELFGIVHWFEIW